MEEGYWVSPSNKEIKGITGMEVALTASINDPNCEVNLLNAAGITTVFSAFGSGYRTWGNRTANFPTEKGLPTFLCARRTADVIYESIEQAMLPFMDKPLNRAKVDAIVESGNSFLRTLRGRGAIINGKMWFDKSLNSNEELANGHAVVSYDFCQMSPLERLTFNASVNTKYLDNLGE
jgi:phage tail sheath protein FI